MVPKILCKYDIQDTITILLTEIIVVKVEQFKSEAHLCTLWGVTKQLFISYNI